MNVICSYTVPRTKAAFQASPCTLQKLYIASYSISLLLPCPLQSCPSFKSNWEGFRRTKRRKCWRAFPCSDLAASGILLWPASTLQVGLHPMHVMHSPRCVHLDASTQMHSSRCIHLDASTLQVGLHLIHVMHSPICIHPGAFT